MILVYNTSNNIISNIFIDGKSGIFWGKNFFLKVLVESLNIIQFSQSKNEGNPVYLVIYGCYGVFPASIKLKKYNGNALFCGRRLDFPAHVQTIRERKG